MTEEEKEARRKSRKCEIIDSLERDIGEYQLEHEKKDKVINGMAKALYAEGYCKEFKCSKCTARNFIDCIKEHFRKEAEKIG